jgi:hypothetical protein
MTDIRVLENSEKQTRLVRKYCAETERALSEVPDYATAVQMKESLCERFQKECDSSLVVTALRQHIDGLLKERWKGHKGASDTKNSSH